MPKQKEESVSGRRLQGPLGTLACGRTYLDVYFGTFIPFGGFDGAFYIYGSLHQLDEFDRENEVLVYTRFWSTP